MYLQDFLILHYVVIKGIHEILFFDVDISEFHFDLIEKIVHPYQDTAWVIATRNIADLVSE